MHVRPLSVFIIESHPLMRKALCAAIDAEPDMRVAGAAERSAETRERVTALHPDVVLIALNNPGPEGAAPIADLRARLPQARILALISEEVNGTGIAARRAGAHSCLSKAASRGELLRIIRELRTMEPGCDSHL